MSGSPKNNNTNKKTAKTEKELRREPRKYFNGTIFYSTKEQLYEGEVKNYSSAGIFVKTSGKFFVGQWLNLALPYLEEKSTKRLGEVVWQNTEGIGIELKTENEF